LPKTPTDNTTSTSQDLVRLALTTRLHETLAQDLAALGYRIDELIADTALSPSQRGSLREIRLSLIDLTKTFRDAIYLPRRHDRAQLLAELQSILAEKTVDIDLTFPLLRDADELLLGEALIEMARNCARHSKAESFSIKYSINDSGMTLHVHDDGQGISSIAKLNIGMRVIDQSLSKLCATYSCEANESGTTFEMLIGSERFTSKD
jgi:signal transduction histidine kinase